jgi:hypothetical protein
MAIRVMHSFDYSTHWQDYEITLGQSIAIALSATTKRTGPQSLQFDGVGFYGATRPAFKLGTQATTFWSQFAYLNTNLILADNGGASGGRGFHNLYGSANFCIGFNESDRSLEVYGPPGFIASSTNVGLLPVNEWIFIEVKIVIAGSPNGSVLIKINGVTEINATGINTGTGYVSSFDFSHQHGSETSFSAYLDDLIVGDGTGDSNTIPPGDARVEYLLPIGAGSKTEFTPLAGTNWGNVDDTPGHDDADYNSSPDTGATDVFAMSNLTGNGLIHGTQSVIRCRKDDAGYRKIRSAFYKPVGVGDTVRLYGGTDAGVGDSFAYYKEIIEKSPDTGAAWTTEELADTQFGYSIGGGSQFSADAWVAEFVP